MAKRHRHLASGRSLLILLSVILIVVAVGLFFQNNSGSPAEVSTSPVKQIQNGNNPIDTSGQAAGHTSPTQLQTGSKPDDSTAEPAPVPPSNPVDCACGGHEGADSNMHCERPCILLQ